MPLAINAQGTLYKVTDAYGNVTYQENPPTDGSSAEILSSGEPESEDEPAIDSNRTRLAAIGDYPLRLFRAESCDACDFVSWFLKNRNIPFEELDVEENIQNQFNLHELTGAYRVPVLVAGDEVVEGFNSSVLKSALIKFGYLEPEAPTDEEETDESESTDDAGGVEASEDLTLGGEDTSS